MAHDEPATEPRPQQRRRSDARSVTEGPSDEEIVKTFMLGKTRKSVLYRCGCVATDPVQPGGRVELLACPTHAAVQSHLRRRQSDRF